MMKIKRISILLGLLCVLCMGATYRYVIDLANGVDAKGVLPKVNGGAGADMSSVTFPSSGTIATTAGYGALAVGSQTVAADTTGGGPEFGAFLRLHSTAAMIAAPTTRGFYIEIANGGGVQFVNLETNNIIFATPSSSLSLLSSLAALTPTTPNTMTLGYINGRFLEGYINSLYVTNYALLGATPSLPVRLNASTNLVSGAIVIDSATEATTSDVTTLNASTSKHGFGPKGSGDTTKFFSADWTERTPGVPASSSIVSPTLSGTITYTETTLTASSTTNFVADFQYPSARITAGAAINFLQSTNRAASRGMTILINPNGANRTITFNASWTWLTATPSTVYSGQKGRLSLFVNGTAETDVQAAYASEGAFEPMPIKTVTSNYTATVSDEMIMVDATSGAVTITLAAASGLAGKDYTIKKVDASGNSVIIDPNASESVDGATTKTISSQYTSVSIRCDSANWYIK